MTFLGSRRVLGSIGRVGGAAILGQLAGLAAAPIITRLYTDVELGQFGLFFGLANVLVMAALLGLPDATLVPREPREARALLSACAWGIVMTTPILAVSVAFVIERDLFGYGALPRWAAWLMPIEVGAVAFLMLFHVWLIRLRDFGTIAEAQVMLGTGRAGGQVAFGWIGAGFVGLAAAEAATRIVACGLYASAMREDLAAASRVGLREAARAAWGHRIFPLFRLPSTLANNVATLLPPALITMEFGVAAAGLYTLMFGVIAAPIGLVQKAVGDVFIGHYVQYHRDDRNEAHRLLLRTVTGLGLLALIPSGVLFIWGDPLFAALFGSEWRTAGVLAAAMAPLFLADMSIGSVGGVLNAVNRPDAKLAFDAARLGGLILAFRVATERSAPLERMVELFAWFGVVAYGVYGLVIYAASRFPRDAPPIRFDPPSRSD